MVAAPPAHRRAAGADKPSVGSRPSSPSSSSSRSPSSGLTSLQQAEVSPGVALLASVLTVLVISLGDLFTGPYLVFAAFYLVPVVTAAWFAGRNAALLLGLFAALAGVVTTAIDPGEVTPPVYVWNGVFRFLTYAFIAFLVDAERRAVATITVLSDTDPLTGLLNRRRFYELAEAELQRARRFGAQLAVIYLDVDDLKLRNDAQGHQAGDEMLVELAEIARARFRPTDLLARLGGDEFCILLPGADLATAEEALGRLVADLRGTPVVPIRVSAGVVAGPVDGHLEVETVVHRADELMYEAKGGGKGRYRTGTSFIPSRPQPG